MSDTDLSMLTATELAQGYEQGRFTPVEATEAALAAVAERNGPVNAMLFVDEEAALAAARESTTRWAEGRPLGPADGIPTALKDLLLTKGWPTLRASTLIPDTGPWDVDSPATARLREGGAVLFGKTTTPEFGWKGVTDSIRHGATGNPWDPGLTAGGSSGGSAAAVGLGMGPWSVGTDGGGSVRIPAAFTGTVALKPTFGQIPIFPPSPYGTLSHAGPMTRSVRDAALLMDLLTLPDSRDWHALATPTRSYVDGLDDGVAGLRIAYSPTLGYGTNDPEVEAAVTAAVQVLAEAGARVEQVDPGVQDPVDAFHVLWFTGAAKVVEHYGPDALEQIDPGLADAIRRHGLGASASDYLDATAVRMDLGVRMGAFHEEWDLLLTPTMPIPAFPVGQPAPDGWPSDLWTSWTPYTYPFNMTQQPALSLPCGFTGDGRPVGLQVVGPRHADALVLRAGQAYQERTDWHRRVPPLVHPPHPTTEEA
ncbi:amidase [Ornithinicoccus hortensis]|uniref:Aspartyl-tRNA(Asn)/glutamyl-tRNA(Gln) amidotransferase subunit A n=1 Tax=Ornithinicoccus hortensis TaxID=82346 RepID=A0A542YWJ3_9MICO|nr:amidase [Ornithinicoccus hortensis]TQL52344.1 aspartyl-tRNA(Asn)/glutamyl-tRNA(Gln) amidotransferase subunit A [Ornithinicoccus hortensis]